MLDAAQIVKLVFQVASAVIVSLGGGGFIVFRLSGYLGKHWADRALQEERHKYEQLNIQLQNQLADDSRRLQSELDNASRRLQTGLDSLKLVHDLRTREEFSLLTGLWKRYANLSFAFHAMSRPGLSFVPADAEERRKLKAKQKDEFNAALYDAQQFFDEVTVFIPEPIAMVAEDTLTHAIRVPYMYDDSGDPQLGATFMELTQRALEEFDSGRRNLEQQIRKHIRGESLGKTEYSD